MHGNPQEALQCAYYAGLMDGEGSFCICVQRLKYSHREENIRHHAMVRIGLTNSEILKEMQCFFKCGKFYAEGVRKGREHYKPMYRWTVINREEIMKVIDKLNPYLREKKQQALLVYEFCKNWKNATKARYFQDPSELHRREDLYQKIRKLNSRGAPATTESLRAERSSDSLNSMET